MLDKKIVKNKAEWVLKNKLKTTGLLTFALILLTLIGLIAKVVYEALTYIVPLLLLGGFTWFSYRCIKQGMKGE